MSEGDDLIEAAGDGDEDKVRKLIRNGVDVNWRGPIVEIMGRRLGRNTPLHHACGKGQNAIVLLLLESGADLSLKDESGQTPLDRARGNNQASTVALLEKFQQDQRQVTHITYSLSHMFQALLRCHELEEEMKQLLIENHNLCERLTTSEENLVAHPSNVAYFLQDTVKTTISLILDNTGNDRYQSIVDRLPEDNNLRRLSSDMERLKIFEESAHLRLSYSNRDWTIPILDIYRICSENLVHYTLECSDVEFVISEKGILLLETLGGENNHLGRIGVLQLAMTHDTRLTDTLKQQLLFGLLLSSNSGLNIVKEDGVLIAPSPEIRVMSTLGGEIKFRNHITSAIPIVPLDLDSLCDIKLPGVFPVHEIVWLFLQRLKYSDPADTLMGTFRLKPYSSVMNKLFYRGKRLTDLFATSVDHLQFVALLDQMKDKGAMLDSSIKEDYLNGNNCVVYRYVRVLDVTLTKDSSFLKFPLCVYYEIVLRNNLPRIPHEQYELERLDFGVKPGSRNKLSQHGFTISEPLRLATGDKATVGDR